MDIFFNLIERFCTAVIRTSTAACLLLCITNHVSSQSLLLYQNYGLNNDNVQANIRNFSGDGSTSATPTNVFEAFPEVILKLGDLRPIPNIDVVSNRIINLDSKRATIHAFRLFTSSATLDTTRAIVGANFLMPEASNYGFIYTRTNKFEIDVFADDQPAAINLFGGLLSKAFPGGVITSTSEGSVSSNLIIHGKIGFETVLVPNLLSVYGNVNAIYNLSNIDAYKNYFSQKKNKTIFFLDYGLRGEFYMNDDNTNAIAFSLGFINNNGDIRKILTNADPVLPLLQIGYKKLIP